MLTFKEQKKNTQETSKFWIDPNKIDCGGC